jgi:hypothetical protein
VFSLGNADDELLLINSTSILEVLAWDGGPSFPDPDGASMILEPTLTDPLSNDNGANWCVSTTPLASGDFATPGEMNDPCFALVDGDGDTFLSDVDCDDADPLVYPGAPEVADDGIDQDCDGADLGAVDADGDGAFSDVDCDDADPTILPGAPDGFNDGIDQDCDGVDRTTLFASELVVGDLIVSEIMQNPKIVTDANGEWYEIYNDSGWDVDLLGLITLDLGTEVHVITASVIVPAGDYAVIAGKSDPLINGGILVDYAWGSGFSLGNADDEIVLANGTGVIDMVAWDGGPTFPDPDGASMSLDSAALNTVLNDLGTSWCAATDVMPSTDLGTPGAPNPSCAP